MTKRNNGIVDIATGNCIEITGLYHVKIVNVKYVILRNTMDMTHIDLCEYRNIRTSTYCRSVTRTNNVIACVSEDLQRKCLLVPLDGDLYVTKLCNRMKTN